MVLTCDSQVSSFGSILVKQYGHSELCVIHKMTTIFGMTVLHSSSGTGTMGERRPRALRLRAFRHRRFGVDRLGAFFRVSGFLASESRRTQVGGDLQSRAMPWARAREIGVTLLIFTFRRPVMKRNFGKGIGVLLFGAVLGLTGCDGGGIEPVF